MESWMKMYSDTIKKHFEVFRYEDTFVCIKLFAESKMSRQKGYSIMEMGRILYWKEVLYILFSQCHIDPTNLHRIT